MAFVPRLPTFQCSVNVWKYDPDTDTYSENEDPLIGQVYTQLRNQDDNTQGTLYFEYPKEDDILRDLKDYNDVGKSDVVVIHFPSNAPRDCFYMCRDVQPRWLEFPNEHLMATLVRLSDLEWNELNPEPPPPAPDEMLVNQVTPSDEACGDCHTLGTTVTGLNLVLETPTLITWLTDPIVISCYPDDLFYQVDYFPVSGLIVLSIMSPIGVSIAGYSGTELFWDMTSLKQLDLTFADDVQCGWGALVSVGAGP